MSLAISGDSPNFTNATLTTPTLTSPTMTSPTMSSPTFTGTATGTVLVSGTSVASTSGTSIDFTSIPSWVKRITVMFNGVSTSGISPLLVQIGDSGGIETSGYVSQAATDRGAELSSTAGFVTMAATAAATAATGIVNIVLFETNTFISSSIVSDPSTPRVNFAAGNKTLSATLDRVRITTVGGTDTFDAGSINIIYE